MPLPVNKIGPYQFIRLDGVPQLPREESIIIQRPGVTGTGFVKTGQRGRQFSLRSVTDVVNWNQAQAANQAYHQLCNSALVDIIFGGINYGAISVQFNVLDVSVDDIKPLAVPVGGLVAGYAIITATWQLIAVKI